MHRIIFLDIDGVLNGHEWCRKHPVPCLRINPKPAEFLNQLLELSKAKVVISSAWSSWIVRGFMTTDGFRRLLLTHGIDANVVDYLDVTPEPADRAAKIQNWIEKKKPDKYLVIDDLPVEGHPIIRPNPATGLQEQDIVQAVKMLA
jgi:hypothetical protein